MILEFLFFLFLACTLIQLVYLVVYIVGLSNIKDTPENYDPKLPVSILVCAKNELKNLKRLLPRLYNQAYSNYEIIVVDDKSNDGTYDFLLEEVKKTELLKVVTVTHTPGHINSKKFAITLGIKAASNESILLTDADCYPANSNWVKQVASRFEGGSKIVLGVSQYERRKGLLNAFIRYETLVTAVQYISAALFGNPYMGVGRNMAYAKSFFMEKKGFGEYQKVVGGDDDLFINKNAIKTNTSIAVGEDALTYSTPKRSWKAYFIQKKRHLSVGKLYNVKDKIILGLFSLTHILFWVTWFALILYQKELYWLLGGFFCRMFLIFIVLTKASNKFGDKLKTYSLPILDFMYVFYYLTTGTAAFFSKRIKWS